jgi:hypothetical protein
MSIAAPWRQAALITFGAGIVLAGFYLLPAGSTLTPMDFLADKATVLQFCDPLNSRPLVADAARPPVTLAVNDAFKVDAASRRVLFTLTTISGKPIGPDDLLPRGHPEVLLTLTDSAGTRYDPVRATPGAKVGEWTFAIEPKGPGLFHVVAMFTPTATGNEVTAAGDLE